MYHCIIFRYQCSDFEEEKLPNKQFPRQRGHKKQYLVQCKGRGNELNSCESQPSESKSKLQNQSFQSEPRKKQNELSNEGSNSNKENTLESYWSYMCSKVIEPSKDPTASKKAKLDYEKKKTEKKITDLASAFGFEEEDE